MPLRLAVLLLAGCIIAPALTQTASADFAKIQRVEVTSEIVWFNGVSGDLESRPSLSGGRIYMSLTDLMRHLGGKIEWSPQTKAVDVTRRGVAVKLVAGSSMARVDGKLVDLGLPAVRRGGLMYVPLRAMCDVFGAKVVWDNKTRKAYVEATDLALGVARRSYPWSDVTGGRNYLAEAPARVSFKNYTGLPVHVRFEGNGFQADWQVHAMSTLGPVFIAGGTYKATIWSRQGEDFESYVTVAPGMDDLYAINVHDITLEAH